MNTFAGTITFEWKIDTKKIQEKYFVVQWENTTVFLFGKTKIEDSEEFIKNFEALGNIIEYDISLSTEDNMNILNTDFEKDGIYECVSFEGAEVDIRDIMKRFMDEFEVISVREAEESEKFGNRIVKVDFVY